MRGLDRDGEGLPRPSAQNDGFAHDELAQLVVAARRTAAGGGMKCRHCESQEVVKNGSSRSERRARERLTKAKRLCNWAERDSLPQAARRAAPEGAGKGMLHPRPHLGFGPFELYGEFFDHAFRHGFDFPPLGRHLPLDAEASRGDLAPRGSPRNFSRRVTFFFPAYSDCAKLVCCFIPAT